MNSRSDFRGEEIFLLVPEYSTFSSFSFLPRFSAAFDFVICCGCLEKGGEKRGKKEERFSFPGGKK